MISVKWSKWKCMMVFYQVIFMVTTLVRICVINLVAYLSYDLLNLLTIRKYCLIQ